MSSMEVSTGEQSPRSEDALHGMGSKMSWSVPAEEFDDYTYPPKHHKQRQRRQRLHSLHSFNSYVAHTSIVAVTASASMLTRQMESMARVETTAQCEDAQITEGVSAHFSTAVADVQSLLGWAVSSFAARLSDLASSLVDAIGEPPQRPLAGRSEDHDLQPFLLLAINLCALCTIASLVFFVFTFFANPEGLSDDHMKPATIEKSPKQLLVGNSTEITSMESPEFHGFFRILSVFCLSLAAGGGLGFRHPFQSAMLCGV